MFLFKKKKIEVYAPISGEIINLEKVNDPVFATKMLGEGFAIRPERLVNATIIAPISGNLTTTMESGHAYGITEKKTKIECLVHVGIDTVELNGKGFEILVKKDQEIAAKDQMANVDLKILVDNNKDVVTPIVFTKDSLASANYRVNVLKTGKVNHGELIAELIQN